jgi:paraquat-inducible protein B
MTATEAHRMAPAKPALVGAFVLCGLALFVVALLLFAGKHLFSRQVSAVTYFQGSVAGLEIGAPVTFRGVRIGSVTGVGISINLKDLSSRIPVYMAINPSGVKLQGRSGDDDKTIRRRLLAAGLEAQLGMQSLVTGELRVDLDLQPGVHPIYLGGDLSGAEIPSSPSKLQTLESQIANLPLKEIADNANQTLVSIRRVTDQLGPRVGPLLDSLKRTSESAHVTMDAAHVAVTHIDSLAIDGQQQVTADGDALKGLIASSDRTVHDADALVLSLNEMTAPNSRMRDDLQSTMRDLAASANSLRTFTHEIERNPSNLLKRGKAP